MPTSIRLAVALALSVVTTVTTGSEAEKQPAPEHQVVAIYFHRTERCPTCKRIGAMSEEAVAKGFQREVKTRGVEFHFIDFQDKKNAKLIEPYGIDSPTLVLLNVFDGETVCGTSLPKVWQLVGKPDEFRAYVQQGVVHYLTQTKEAAQKERAKSKESKE